MIHLFIWKIPGSIPVLNKWENKWGQTNCYPLESCKRWAVTEFGIYGSCANATEHAESDVDVLVSFTPEAEWSLFDLVTIQLELQEIFGRDVDLVEKAALKNPFRKKSILDSVEVIYAA